MDHLLNCNKMKKLTTSLPTLVKAIAQSKKLELSTDKKQFRRKGNPKLPELQLLNKKRKNDDKVKKFNIAEDIIIFEVKSDKSSDLKFKLINDEFSKLNPVLEVVYCRFVDTSGHIGVLKNSEKPISMKVKEFKIDDYNFKVEKCEGDNLISFWKDHGSHLDMCLKRNCKSVKDRIKQEKEQSKRNREKKIANNLVSKTTLKAAIKLGFHRFLDIKDIRQKTRTIISKIEDDVKLESNDHSFLVDLVKYHPNKEKSADLDHFIVSKNKDHGNSRCFFIVRTNGVKEDFSVNKCLDNILKTHGDS